MVQAVIKHSLPGRLLRSGADSLDRVRLIVVGFGPSFADKSSRHFVCLFDDTHYARDCFLSYDWWALETPL